MRDPEHERRFDLFGSEVRLLVGAPAAQTSRSPELAALEVEAFLRVVHRELTRFEPHSELSALNAAPASEVRASPLLAMAVRAGIWAAGRSEALVDFTLIGELERIGYASSRAGMRPAPLEEAVAAAPKRRPARPHPGARWREISVDAPTGIVTRPAGLRIDTGGIGKGMAADLASARLRGYELHVVDAGGDLRIGGERPTARLVEIEHPLGAAPLGFHLVSGAVATSGIATRLWRTESGFAHHLLDPSTGEPAWTGVIQATSLGETALEAETLSKMAFLAGAKGAREVLAAHGGLIVLDNGKVELVGALAHGTPAETAAAA